MANDIEARGNRFGRRAGGSRWLAPALLAAGALSATSCGDVDIKEDPVVQTQVPAGELCNPPRPEEVRLRIRPDVIVLSEGQQRQVEVVVDPDFCQLTGVSFESSDSAVVAAPESSSVDYNQPTLTVPIEGGTEVGTAELTVRVAGSEATAVATVEVMSGDLPECTSNVTAELLATGSSVSGADGASISLPANADRPNFGAFWWSTAPFAVDISCGDDITPDGYLALGPAITFGPAEKVLQRELPLTIPVNPARLPEKALLRHLQVAYSGPAFLTPRTIPVANPRFEKVDGRWLLSFKVPRLGTYQAVVKEDAGSHTYGRRLTHRAVIGISMGGAGAAEFGLRHHHLFDVVAPLGGPVHWTWMMDHIYGNHMGGFRPIPSGTQLEDIPLEKTVCTTDAECQPDETCVGVLPTASGRCTFMPKADEPYEHPSTFVNWWYEYPKTGNGGSFPRREYVQIFRDLSLMYGNPNGYNPLSLNLPTGVDPDHPSQTGNHPNGECKIWIDPLEGPDEDTQKEIADNCPIERCQHTQVLEGYYDDEYNPDGTFPVITFCDGSPQNGELTPFANTWTPGGSNNHPMEVALAVDYNANGVRDELEPVIRSGREHWDDYGTDQTPSIMEPGYGPDNLDPAGDDYDPQYNPNGTEGDRRYQPGEAFDDTGLDGVMGTSDSPYDWGEGDGKLTVAPGLQRFWDFCPHSVLHRVTTATPGGELDDEALGKLDLWTDGGTRDLFNFAVAARHLVGGFAARGRNVAYYTEFNMVPGLDPAAPNAYDPALIDWGGVPGTVMLRYGADDPDDQDVENGSGQHVGTAAEVLMRLQLALYYIGSRWPDAPLAQHDSSANKPAEGVPECEITGSCTLEFTASDGRTGPVGITLPPGYAHADLQHVRYPVIYMLHGYGMTPTDLLATIAFLKNWMNAPLNSQASRLPKAILVYVDGRCRWDKDGQAECIRGTFFTDSIREDGPQITSWWLELMDYIDQNYRTMGESLVDWTE